MAENGGNRGQISTARLPVTAAPTRSQSNLACGTPGVRKLSVEDTQSAGRPPSGESVARLLQLINAASAAVEIPETPRHVRPDITEEAPKQRTRRKLRSFAAQFLLVVTCVIAGMVVQQAFDTALVLPPTSPAVIPPPPETKSEESRALPDDPGTALTTAIDDLDHALFDFPGKTPEQLLKSVSRPGQDCTLVWSGHYPSLVFGRQPISPNSLTGILEGCARAVKHLPR